ncbi:Na(+)/H(+) antiporter subunit C [Pengzhenrongella frigida]|uniref:Na(+)/H(+) antiporter subunit C n=1 Tax=Pengzhenrongella frigida TaxID=1259133 RepID=A0A4Q5MZ38_9MICO|nr:Na(+)/H(+) antiporter subunit C [Cellulomonas sp. HLT2-17]RYV50970.1 Na(+)/H(+) antiporter subunit C [Cellulomonas sp. HLT2-17]
MSPDVSPDMSPNLVLVVVIAVLVTTGVYLLLERSLSRVLIGIILLGNGINLSFLVAGGAAGGAPIVGTTPEGEMSDPLPQAMVLTAIVITLGMTAFLLALAYRSWQLHRHDEVQDDVEDRRIARIAARDEPIFEDADADMAKLDLERDAAEARDEIGLSGAATTPSEGPR